MKLTATIVFIYWYFLEWVLFIISIAVSYVLWLISKWLSIWILTPNIIRILGILLIVLWKIYIFALIPILIRVSFGCIFNLFSYHFLSKRNQFAWKTDFLVVLVSKIIVVILFINYLFLIFYFLLLLKQIKLPASNCSSFI